MPDATCSWNRATIQPPTMPTKSAMIVNTGAMKMPGQHARDDQLPDGIGAEGAQRVDLIGHDHRAELGRDARADAAAQHQPRQHRTQFLDHRRADQPAHHRPGPELVQRQAALKGEHGAR